MPSSALDFQVLILIATVRIGPRKLLRSIATAKDSITPFRVSDLVHHQLGSDQSTPRVVKGDNGDTFPWDSRGISSSASTPSVSGVQELEPVALQSNAKAGRPKLRPEILRRATACVTESTRVPSPPATHSFVFPEAAPPAASHRGSSVMLVEDNDLNMKVSLPQLLSCSQCLTTDGFCLLPASRGFDEEDEHTMAMRYKWPGGIRRIHRNPVEVLPHFDGCSYTVDYNPI